MFRARFSRLLRQLGIPAVPHGFRSSFRDWAAECTNAPHAVMEAALAHTNPNKAEAAYRLRHLRRALSHICKHRDKLWIATGGEIASYFAESVPAKSSSSQT